MATDLGQHVNLVLCQRQIPAQGLSFEYGQTDNYDAMWQVLQQRYKQGTLGTRSLHVSRSFPSQPRILSALPLRSRLSSLRESGPTGLSAKPPISFSAFIFYFSPRNVSSLVTITIILSTREQWFKVYKALSHPLFHLITSSSTFLEPILGISLV